MLHLPGQLSHRGTRPKYTGAGTQGLVNFLWIAVWDITSKSPQCQNERKDFFPLISSINFFHGKNPKKGKSKLQLPEGREPLFWLGFHCYDKHHDQQHLGALLTMGWGFLHQLLRECPPLTSLQARVMTFSQLRSRPTRGPYLAHVTQF